VNAVVVVVAVPPPSVLVTIMLYVTCLDSVVAGIVEALGVNVKATSGFSVACPAMISVILMVIPPEAFVAYKRSVGENALFDATPRFDVNDVIKGIESTVKEKEVVAVPPPTVLVTVSLYVTSLDAVVADIVRTVGCVT